MTSPLRLVVLVSCLVSLNAIADVYSWTDEDGNKHFSDEPPAKGARDVRKEKFEPHNIDSGYPPGIVVNPNTDAEEREQSEREAKAAARKREDCQKARKQLRVLSRPVIFKDEDGNQVYVSEKERAEMERELRAKIEKHCGG